MIKITSLNKIYQSKKRKRCFALNDVNLTLPDAGLVFVLGKSGSGKSTLLNLIGGLDNVTSGSIEVDGNDLAKFKEREFCNYRNTHIGFIFQDYHLIDELTVYDNIALSLNLLREDDREKVLSALARVDLAGYEDRYPSELSGGEQQRVAIARAIVKRPRIILADEPTGNLDTNTARSIIELLKDLSKECLILIVSHNINDANNYADRIIELRKGRVICDKIRNPDFPDEIILAGEELIYPENTNLTEKDISLINRHKNANLVLKKDKFLPTQKVDSETKKLTIKNKNLSFAKETLLSGKFLKNKTFAISLSAFMVAVIMIIMSLAQTIIAFDGATIINEEMKKINQNSMFLRKILDENDQLQTSGNYHIILDKGDIQAFYDAGYNGKIYEGITYSIPITNASNMIGKKENTFQNTAYIQQTLATLIVDEEFLKSKFGEVKYCAKRNTFHPQGVVITDYVADAILQTQKDYLLKDYEYLVQYGYTINGWKDDVFIINGIIETGYRETYADIFKQLSNNPQTNLNDLHGDAEIQSFLNDIYDRLGYSYSLNPNFLTEYLAAESWRYPGYFRIVINDQTELPNTYLYIINQDDNESKQSEFNEPWRYTEKALEIPEGAKYIRLTCHPSSLEKYSTKYLDSIRDYPILVFDNGVVIGREKFLHTKNFMLDANGNLKSQSSTYVSDYIEIPENATISEFLNFASRNFAYCSFYDADKNYLSSEKAGNILNIAENTIVFPIQTYMELFPDEVKNAGDNWIENFVPHKAKLSHFAYWDTDKSDPLFEKEVMIDITSDNKIYMSDDLLSLFYKDSVFSSSLYFNGTDGIGTVLNSAETLNYEPQSLAVEGVYTMTKAVDVFIPIFELIAVILSVGVIFILVNFSSKMINDKMHEIGILKALGTKNSTVFAIFGLQVTLIAILTCVLSTIGYYFFIDLANDVLIESLKRLAPSSIVLDLDFLIFKPQIALQNCALIFVLTLTSLTIPMLKIKAIKPVKIIKAKES